MSEAALSIQPVAGALGAEVSGIDLSQPLSPTRQKELHDAWMQHQVLFFRDQPITIEQHKDFARHFGDLHVHPVIQPRRDEGHPEVVVLLSGGRFKFVADKWHSDVTFQHRPPLGSVLRALEVPEQGGDTMWSSMYAAYEDLSGEMQRLLSGLRAVNDGGGFKRIASQEQAEALDQDNTAVHPVIRTHPVTGRKAVFVNSTFTKRIEGMKPAESDALLRFLFDHVGQPQFTCRFRWRKDSIAMWDNRCTQHRVVADNLVDRRHMERITIVGDEPF
ncbi:MAG: TauD/TfdA dioxygenase family protein [Myxococcota bacterium]